MSVLPSKQEKKTVWVQYLLIDVLWLWEKEWMTRVFHADVMRRSVFVSAVPMSVWVYVGRADRTLRHAESVLFCDTLPLFTCHIRIYTHNHTHTRTNNTNTNDSNMVQAVRNPPGAGSHSVIPLYLSLPPFISFSIFISLCLSLSLCIHLFVPSLYIKTATCFFWLVFFPLFSRHRDPPCVSFYCLSVWQQFPRSINANTHKCTHAYKYNISRWLTGPTSRLSFFYLTPTWTECALHSQCGTIKTSNVPTVWRAMYTNCVQYFLRWLEEEKMCRY